MLCHYNLKKFDTWENIISWNVIKGTVSRDARWVLLYIIQNLFSRRGTTDDKIVILLKGYFYNLNKTVERKYSLVIWIQPVNIEKPANFGIGDIEMSRFTNAHKVLAYPIQVFYFITTHTLMLILLKFVLFILYNSLSPYTHMYLFHRTEIRNDLQKHNINTKSQERPTVDVRIKFWSSPYRVFISIPHIP
jgi:hypothetical protein